MPVSKNPPTFPAPTPDGVYSLRFYEEGTATANFTDNKWAFTYAGTPVPATPVQGWSHYIRVRATGGDLYISFDGVTVHGHIFSGQDQIYEQRHEGGISVRGAGIGFLVEAW